MDNFTLSVVIGISVVLCILLALTLVDKVDKSEPEQGQREQVPVRKPRTKKAS